MVYCIVNVLCVPKVPLMVHLRLIYEGRRLEGYRPVPDQGYGILYYNHDIPMYID